MCIADFFPQFYLYGNIRKRMNFRYFKYLKSKCSSRSRSRNLSLWRSITNVWMCIVDFFHNYSFAVTYENEGIIYILNVWIRKRSSKSQSSKYKLTAFYRLCVDEYCWFFHNYSFRKTDENERISYILNILNRKRRSRSRRRKTGITLLDCKFLSM